MTQFRIDIETSAGVKQGDGPILSAIQWDSTPRLRRAGKFKFTMPAADPRAAQVVAKRVARCYALINGSMTAVGAGIIDKIRITIGRKGEATLEVEGDDLLRELTYRHVGQLHITTTAAPADIMAFAPAGWSVTNSDGSTPATSATAIDHTFEGESVLAALGRLAEITGENFRLGAGRVVVWLKTDQTASGKRAISGGDPVSLETNTDVCIITDLQEEQDTFDLASRIYPYGAGDGDARYTLSGTAWAAPAGYTLDAVNNYIKRNQTETDYGQIERYVSFKDIKAADALALQAYAWLVRYGAVYKSYRLTVTKLDAVIYPGQTILVVYKKVVDGYVAVSISASLVVLEPTTRIDARGVRTVAMQVATVDRYPEDDISAITGSMGQSESSYTHPQRLDSDLLDAAPAPGAHAASHGAGQADAVTLAVSQISDLMDVTGSEKTISGGVISTGGKQIEYHDVDTEGDAASDDLDTINGGAIGDLLVIKPANSSRTVVAKDASGNLQLAGDFSMDNGLDTMVLLCVGSNWVELSRSDNGA